jgi:hypothetical protein
MARGYACTDVPDLEVGMGTGQRLRAAMSERTKLRIDLKPKYADQLEGFVGGIGKEWVMLAAPTT